MARIFAIVEEGGKFGLGRAGNNFLHDGAQDIDCAVTWQ
jgi:hypothetical protein